MKEARIEFIKACPLCEQGLCRVRVAETETQAMKACVVCDECEAIWTDPTLRQRYVSANYSHPSIPNEAIGIWDSKTRWGSAADLCLLGWYRYRHRD